MPSNAQAGANVQSETDTLSLDLGDNLVDLSTL